jgi:hypothetical protein
MSIPITPIKISLKPAIPTEMTATGLKQQLNAIGLNCDDTLLANLKGYIQEVKNQIPAGGVQTFRLTKPTHTAALTYLLGNLEDSSKGNWEPKDVGTWETKLAFIQQEEHFAYLKATRGKEFPGIEDNPPQYNQIYSTIAAIKEMFVRVGVDASATLIKGLDKNSIESLLSNVIAPLDDTNAKDYNKSDSRIIFLVNNYRETPGPDGVIRGVADGVGVLAIEWSLKIADYKKKKEQPSHETWLTIKSRSILYSDDVQMEADYALLKAHYKQRAFALLNIPIDRPKATIFTKRPPADEDTFNKSIVKLPTANEIEVIVLYAPDLQLIGSIDNTKSDTTTTYSQSVTMGFTFSATQSLSIESSLEADFEVVKAGLKVTTSISFTEEWSQSRTISMNFEVPAGKKAFNYQGYIMAEILSFDAKKGTYSYKGDRARCLTNVLTSLRAPIDQTT